MDYQKRREELHKESARNKIAAEAAKRIRTTMIGALASIEKYLGEVWGHKEDNISHRQEEFRELYALARQEILDKGNEQIRELGADLNNYDITWKKFHITLLPVNRGTSNE